MRTMIDWSFKEIKKLLPKDPEALLGYKLPREYQDRIHELLELNSEGTISVDERRELDQILKVEERVRGMMAKALERRNREK